MSDTVTSAARFQIQAPSAAKQVSDTLRDLILRGELAPGAAVEEAPTAESFGVSRNTVREAIRDLARAGLVTQSRLRPAVVVSLTPDAVEDIFRVRRLLEVASAEVVAESAPGPLPLVEEALATLAAATDWHQQAAADHAFHSAIVASTGSDRLVRAFEAIGSEVRLCLGLTDRWDTQPADQRRQHAAILEALQQRDAQRVATQLRAHIDDARERVLNVLARGAEASEAAGGA